ncbi:MAG: DUF11 domain-containing protein [Bacteriovoracaceae bacterium]
MKTIVITTVLICSFAFGQGTQMDLYEYQLQANTNLKIKNGRISFIAVKPAKDAKDEMIFGYWLSNNTNANAVCLEVKDGQKSIAAVTAKDFSAKAKIQRTGNKSTATYTTGSGAAAVTIIVEADVVYDQTMPLGKAVQVDVKVKTSANKNLSTVMSLYADGFVNKIGSNGLTTSRMEKGKPVFPLVLLIGTTGTSVSTDNAEQKSAGKIIKLMSSSVTSTGDAVTMLSFRTHATTVKNYEKSAAQAVNVENVITVKKEKTELSLQNSASKSSPFPGDTLTYMIAYHNIGTSPAQDIVVSNVIPVNTFYVDKSAEGDGAEVTLDRRKVNPPQVGEVTSVSWKITKKVMPGEEGSVSFKAVVR